MELATGRTLQLTNAVTGCLMPTVLKREGEIDQVVYSGFWRGGFDLYLVDIDKPVGDETTRDPAGRSDGRRAARRSSSPTSR